MLDQVTYEFEGQTYPLSHYLDKANVSGFMVLHDGEVRLEFCGKGLNAQSRNHALVERLRMEEACRLLSESQHSIEVIADQVGYASAFSYSAAFKRFVGKPPSRFRLDADAGAGRR